MKEVILTRKELIEILEQNKQFAKNYFVNYMIASNAIKFLEKRIKKLPQENKNDN
jgi:hypothetical protein